MRKRRGRSKSLETLISRSGVEEKVGDGNVGKEGKRFFACYLLVSLSPRHKGHTYIGFTVNPRRRIRQHNGEIVSGAWRTKKKRPWEMVLCIYGFPSNVSALQFEWAWQHPNESLAVRKAAASFKSVSGIANKIKMAYTMLTLPAWQSLNITVNYFSTKYTNHYAGCPNLPEHMKVQVCPMDELPCYSELRDVSLSENEDEWDNKEECDGGSCTASGFVQETIPDSMVQNSSDNEIDIMDPMAEFFYGQGNELEKDCAESSCFITTSSPIATRSVSLEEFADGRDMDKAASVELQLPVVTSGYTAQPPSSSYAAPHHIEIIDISTPSPDCRTSLCGKKRRISTICPQIIDLTKSPAFVQL
ncbi:structure-specific endonuclease subunit SLX1 [Carya illinoinensis]|nr:structure-specific endonuclease subunit SLX1 [Carya illinoinensis]